MSSVWQHLSVGEFCDRSNWSGKKLTSANTVELLSEVSWLCQKTADFFSRSNWRGEIFKEISQSDFSLTLTVEELFQLFAWEANSPTIVSLPKLESISHGNSTSDRELNLDDFSNLF